jgi:RNA-directed DNA polymerase
MNATARPAYEWKDLPWPAIERHVFKLQTRIFQASGRGDVRTVHRLQRLLTHSWSAKCLAVRRVTQDNRGKKTAGVDGVKALRPPQRLRLVATLSLTKQARPLRRVWILKPHGAEQRPLGIPVLHDRAAQALAKLGLEPEWEAKFEPNSYGFRPGRSCHDAIKAIRDVIKNQDRWVLDADIRHCFDRISHQALLAKLHTYAELRRSIRGWLKAGVLDEGVFSTTDAGTPQGGVVSPLLANIALHGMETYLQRRCPARTGRQGYRSAVKLIRYADDLVVLHTDRAAVEAAQPILGAWLAGMGLELKPEKTRLTHTRHGEEPGFNFLGFTVRQFPRGKHRTAHSARGQALGFGTMVTPSKEACKAHQRKLKDVIRRARAATQVALIGELNPIIRGWTRYYSTANSSQVFAKQNDLTQRKLVRWAQHRHAGASRTSLYRRYWSKGWRFTARADGQQLTLALHTDTRLNRHVKVQGTRSPYDGDWLYWGTRMGRHPELSAQVARLLKRQQGKCAACGLQLKVGDLVENDHLVPRSQHGSGQDENRQLLHRHCHDTKSAHDRGQATEEPDAGKLARPVLKTGGRGDPVA